MACSSARSKTSKSASNCTTGQSRSPLTISALLTSVTHCSKTPAARLTNNETSPKMLLADKMSPERNRISCAEVSNKTACSSGSLPAPDNSRMAGPNGKGRRERMEPHSCRCSNDQCGNSVKTSQITGDKAPMPRKERFLRPAWPSKPNKAKREDTVCSMVVSPDDRISWRTSANSTSPSEFRSANTDAFSKRIVQLVAGQSWGVHLVALQQTCLCGAFRFP